MSDFTALSYTSSALDVCWVSLESDIVLEDLDYPTDSAITSVTHASLGYEALGDLDNCSDVLDASYTYVSSTGTGYNYTPATRTWSIPNYTTLYEGT